MTSIRCWKCHRVLMLRVPRIDTKSLPPETVQRTYCAACLTAYEVTVKRITAAGQADEPQNTATAAFTPVEPREPDHH